MTLKLSLLPVSLFVLAACGAKQAPDTAAAAPPEVGVLALRASDVPVHTELSGRTAAFRVSEVRPQVNGIVRKRLFEEGSTVRAGQVLYEIEPGPFEAAHEQAQATLATSQAGIASLRGKAERFGELVKANAVSQQEHEDAQAALVQAQAGVKAAQAAVKAARINLEFTRITAPIAGRIGRSSVTEGALVAPGQAAALATIQRIDPIYVDVVGPSSRGSSPSSSCWPACSPSAACRSRNIPTSPCPRCRCRPSIPAPRPRPSRTASPRSSNRR
jgi:membrane fusion protein (multidrug efflux system)